jgi:hypothetical protein
MSARAYSDLHVNAGQVESISAADGVDTIRNRPAPTAAELAGAASLDPPRAQLETSVPVTPQEDQQ